MSDADGNVPDSSSATREGGFFPAALHGAPSLKIETLAGGKVRLLWPTNDVGFTLQSNTNLNTTNWLFALLPRHCWLPLERARGEGRRKAFPWYLLFHAQGYQFNSSQERSFGRRNLPRLFLR